MRATWITDLTQEDVRGVFGAATALRGWDYAFRDRVASLTELGDEDASILGSVHGSEGRVYSTVVSARRVPGGVSVTSTCSCSVDFMCKHGAAVIFAVQRDREASGGISEWERQLTRALDAAEPVPTEPLQIALQFDLPRRKSAGRRREAPDDAPEVTLRPVIRGARGAWVRAGISWLDLTGPDGAAAAVQPVQREALLGLHNLAVAHGGSYLSYSDRPVSLQLVGPNVWAALAVVVARGVPLVGAKALSGGVRLAQASADLRVAHDGRDLVLTPVLSVEDADLDPTTVHGVGDPVHGFFAVMADELVLGGLSRPPAPVLNRLLHLPKPLRVPGPEVGRFLAEYAPRLSAALPALALGDELGPVQPAPPRLLLELTYVGNHVLDVIWSITYNVRGEPLHYPLRDDGRSRLRDTDAEWLLERTVLSIDGVDGIDDLTMRTARARVLYPEVRLDALATAHFVQRVLPALRTLPGLDIRQRGEPPQYRLAQGMPLVEVSAHDDPDDPDWFNLNVTVRIDGEQVPLPELMQALAAGEHHLILGSGLYFALDRPELVELRRLVEEARGLADTASGTIRVTPLHAGWWADLVALGVPGEQSERWRAAVDTLLSTPKDPPPIPRTVSADLRPYQRDGYTWLSLLWDMHLGGILADDMGLGKTLQTLTMIDRAKQAGALTAPILVVAPTSVVGTWAGESHRFTPQLQVVSIEATNKRRKRSLEEVVRGADVVLTSYAIFRIDAAAYRSMPWSGLVLDEAQFVKNHQAKTYQAARRLPAPFKLAITGTPMENSLMDLWSLLSIVAPGLFPDPDDFTTTYRRPIENDRDGERLALFRRRVRPLMLRRAKEDVAAELPPKQEQVLRVELHPAHQRLYQRHLTRERGTVLGLMEDLSRNRIHVLAALTRLRQLSLSAALVGEQHADLASAKIDTLVEHVHELAAEGHRALVFSQFTGFLALIRQRLEAEGIGYSYLDGSTRDRAARIDGFRGGHDPVFLISLKAGGFGLNLTEADYVFVMDPWWNPAAEEQAIDRTHRIGQNKTVMVYRLVSADTIEEKVVALQDRKRELFRNVIDDAQLSAPSLTAQDIRQLLA